MQHEKLTEVLVSCFYADDDTVVIGDISDEIWHSTKKYEGEQQRLQIIWYHRFKFQDR